MQKLDDATAQITFLAMVADLQHKAYRQIDKREDSKGCLVFVCDAE